MAKIKNKPTQPQSPGQALAPHYRPGDPKESFWEKAKRVLLWALMVAAVAALVAIITYLTGGVSLPVGMALGNYILIQMGIGFAEGLLYGSLSEVMGNKQAQGAIQAMATQPSMKPVVVRVSQEQIEAEIRQEESMKHASSQSTN